METIDNYCEVYSVIPDLLKIDVEGHELDVLKVSLNVIDKISIIKFNLGAVILILELFSGLLVFL